MFLFALFSLIVSSQVSANYDFKPKDIVVFMGDSNTEHGSYPKLVASAVHKELKDVRFHNLGVSGSKAWDGINELKKVFRKKATVIFITYGINDIGWGNDQSVFTRNYHIQSIMTLTQNLRMRGIRVIVQSYFMTDYPRDGKTSPVAGEVTETSTSYLQLLSNDVMTIAERMGAETIDVQSHMRKKAQETADAFTREDGVHLNSLGNEWAAEAILNALSLN